MSSARHILTMSCANRPGIVARVSAALFEGGFNILDAQQFDDTETGNFFMRVEFNAVRTDADIEALRGTFGTMAGDLGMAWTMRPSDQRKRVALMVSRFDHCLVDLLYRWRSGEMPMEPVAIIANYPRESYAHIDFGDIPFHFLPVTRRWCGSRSSPPEPTLSCSPATCRFCRTVLPPSCRDAASTSTTPSCPASRAPSPTTRRMSGGSS